MQQMKPQTHSIIHQSNAIEAMSAEAYKSIIFRPRGFIIFLTLIPPVFLTLIAILLAIYLRSDSFAVYVAFGVDAVVIISVAIAAFALAGSIFCIVETNDRNIMVIHPWKAQNRQSTVLEWQFIESASYKNGFIHLRDSKSHSATIFIRGMENGNTLLREAAIRISQAALDSELKLYYTSMNADLFQEIETIQSPNIFIDSLWIFLSVLIAVIGVISATAGSLLHIALLLIIGGIIGFTGVLLMLLFGQKITITGSAITIKNRLIGPKTIFWADISAVRIMPNRWLFSIRTQNSGLIIGIGPYFMSAIHDDILIRAIISRIGSQQNKVMKSWKL